MPDTHQEQRAVVVTSHVSLVLEGELWGKHGFSQTLLLNSVLEIVIVFSVLTSVGSGS